MPIIITSYIAPPVNWMALLGTVNQDIGGGMAVDSVGNIISGGFYQTGGANGFDTILEKQSPSGSIIWQRSMGDTSTNQLNTIAVDTSDNIYIASFSLLAKYNSSGVLQWQRKPSQMSIESIHVLSTGEILAVGNSSSLGPGANSAMISKFNSDGSTAVWERVLGTGGNGQFFFDVAVDSGGNIYACGSAALGLLAKYNSSGVLQFQKSLGGGGTNPSFYGITIDSSDNVYVVGTSVSPEAGALIVKYNTSGTVISQKRLSSTSATFLRVTVDGAGNPYAIGRTLSTGKIYFAKFDSSLNVTFQRSIGETNATNNQGNEISIHSSGDICLTGNLDNIGEGGVSDLFTARLPADGSETGTYSLGGKSVVYGSVSNTLAATTYTEGTTAHTDSSETGANTANTLTDSAGSLAQSFVVVP